ncbi:hypothetical protein [Promicromonospora kroppenstedtii]|uniref:hypothetical protein n=1 Tax=Promicromonospora kroppenstedtii TaxID=440482 RepID=UPI0004B58FAC|nr:hypothetical protein [Promicromonospora kroppenstedtii]
MAEPRKFKVLPHKPETTTEEVHVDHTGLLQPGDVVSRVPDDRFGVIVRREVPVPARPEPGTAGTATVSGKAGVRVMRVQPDDRDPRQRPWVSDHLIGGWFAHAEDEVADFTSDAPPALPTREALAKAIKGGNETTPNPFLASGVLVEVDPELAADRVLALLKEARP